MLTYSSKKFFIFSSYICQINLNNPERAMALLSHTHLSKASFRTVYRIPILISVFNGESVDFWFVPFHRDCPKFEIQSSKFVCRYWTRWNVVMRKALVAWNVIVVVGTHDEGCRRRWWMEKESSPVLPISSRSHRR